MGADGDIKGCSGCLFYCGFSFGFYFYFSTTSRYKLENLISWIQRMRGIQGAYNRLQIQESVPDRGGDHEGGPWTWTVDRGPWTRDGICGKRKTKESTLA